MQGGATRPLLQGRGCSREGALGRGLGGGCDACYPASRNVGHKLFGLDRVLRFPLVVEGTYSLCVGGELVTTRLIPVGGILVREGVVH